MDFGKLLEPRTPKSVDEMTIDELFGCPYCEEYTLDKKGRCTTCSYTLELMQGDIERRRQWLRDHPGEE